MSVVLILTFFVVLCSTATAQNQVVNSVNEFGLDYLKNVVPREQNSFFSSASMATALAMVAAGARGRSHEQLLRTLKLDGLDNVHDRFNEVMVALSPRVSSNGSYELNMANKLAIQASYPLLDEFVDILRSKYLSSVDEMDFRGDGAKAAEDINSWVSEQTRGMISKIFNQPISADTTTILINAIYFKGSWVAKFDATNTKKRTFHGTLRDNDVLFMYKKDKIKAHRDWDRKMSVIELPYIGNASMVVFLHDEKNGLDQFLESLSASDIKQLTSDVQDAPKTTAELYMPKFKIETSYDLTKVLPAIGVKDIFSQTSADLSGINGRRDLYVGEALHKAVVDVDEEGTKAAAVTAVRMMTRSAMASRPVVFEVDRPFLFVIRDNLSGLNLFTGRIGDL